MDPRGQVGQELMSAAGVSGIPHAFVVDAGGTVQFSGHPMDPGFEAAVQKVRHSLRLPFGGLLVYFIREPCTIAAPFVCMPRHASMVRTLLQGWQRCNHACTAASGCSGKGASP